MARQTSSARRAQIVEGLKQVMATQGYAGANMRAIADAAGLTPGLLHYHFSSKQAILLGLLDSLAAAWSARIDPDLQGEAALRAVVDATLAVGQGDPAARACWLQIGALAAQSEAVQAAWQAVMRQQVNGLITMFTAEGKGADEAAALLALLEGYLRLGTSCPGVVPAGSAAPLAHRVLTGLLA